MNAQANAGLINVASPALRKLFLVCSNVQVDGNSLHPLTYIDIICLVVNHSEALVSCSVIGNCMAAGGMLNPF
jgi:hypothetical protein